MLSIFAACLCLFGVVVVAGDRDREYVPLSRCEALGFTAGATPCSACNSLAEALGSDDPILSDCRDCCSPSIDFNSLRQYDSATLQLCQARLQSYGGVNEWLEKSAINWASQMEIVDDCSIVEPVIVLQDDGGAEGAESAKSSSKGSKGSKSTASARSPEFGSPNVGRGTLNVPISNWKVEHIDAFLKAKLRPEA